jgi:hypothetical protein
MEPCLGIRLVCPRELLALKTFSLEEASQAVALTLQASSCKPSLPQDGAHSMTVTGGGAAQESRWRETIGAGRRLAAAADSFANVWENTHRVPCTAMALACAGTNSSWASFILSPRLATCETV